MLVAVVSDIHSNLAAFEAVLADLPPVDEVWCLGDVVGYGPDPNECLQTLLSQKQITIAGNHDWAAVGLLDVSYFNHDARIAAEWTANRLTSVNREIIRRLPQEQTIGEFTLVHGSPRDPIWEYIVQPNTAVNNLPYFNTRYCLVGHTHSPAVFWGPAGKNPAGSARPEPGSTYELGERRLIVNPGSVGQPRDRDPRAAYALLDLTKNEVQFRRVAYDVQATQNKMKAAGLPQSLWARLAVGW